MENANQQTIKTTSSHLIASNKWNKNNPIKRKCQSITQSHSKDVEVIYECRCVSGKKQNHHFDYSRPYEVIRLCVECHIAEHKRRDPKIPSNPPQTKYQGNAKYILNKNVDSILNNSSVRLIQDELWTLLLEDYFKNGRGWIVCVSKEIGLSYSQLYKIIHRISQGKISSWEKIYKYYEKKK